MRRPIAILLGLTVGGFAACKKTVDGPMPLCASEVEGGAAQEVQSQNVPPEVWFALVLQSFNAKTGEAKRPVRDCTNKPLEIHDAAIAACVQPSEPPAALPLRPLDGDQDLEIIGLDDGRALVWVRTEYFDNGDALGPVAVAEFRANGLAIRTLGPLRANPNRVRMRLEPLGEASALVVESMVCPPDDPKACARVMRVLPQEGNRFVERPLIHAQTDACLGPATFALSRAQEVTRGDGIIRRFELARTVDFEDGEVAISEQLIIKDIDPEQPDAPPTIVRKAQIERPLRLSQGGLQTTEALWDRLLAEHGSVEVRASEAVGDTDAGSSEAPGG